MEVKLTAGQTRALEAVRQGTAYRIYRRDGNVMRGPKGVGAKALRALERLGLICDDPAARGRGLEFRIRLIARAAPRVTGGLTMIYVCEIVVLGDETEIVCAFTDEARAQAWVAADPTNEGLRGYKPVPLNPAD